MKGPAGLYKGVLVPSDLYLSLAIGMVDISRPPIRKGDVMDDLSVSLRGETLSWIDKVNPLPRLTKKAYQRCSQRRIDWAALGRELP
jgi:hypothetical protein